MYSTVKTAVLHGIESIPVQVETNLSEGMPVFEMVGFLSPEVKEARERVRIGLQNSGILLPAKRIIINLSPADIRKSGTSFDLAVAVSVLGAMGKINPERIKNALFLGEIGLNGEILPVHGVLSAAILARKKKIRQIFVPEQNRDEAAIFSDLDVIPVRTLSDLLMICSQESSEPFVWQKKREIPYNVYEEDFAEICGQKIVIRACEIAASGMHNLLMIGPPGSGKTMIARRIPSILPSMEFDEMLELSQIYALSRENQENVLCTARPFRSPHHTVTPQALCGGGKYPVPGEISLAHKGVLFLDELPEFPKNLIDLLRQPIEEKRIYVSRVGNRVAFPCDFMLVAAMNPCKCGYYPDIGRCRCTPASVHSYINHISQPMLDRIDMSVETRELSYRDLAGGRTGESSAKIRARVERTHRIQKARFSDRPYHFNSGMPGKDVEIFCRTDAEGDEFLRQVMETDKLSVRSYYKLLKVARTIADMEEAAEITADHLREAYACRSLDKKYWGRI